MMWGNGLKVMWDGRSRLIIHVPTSLKNKMCGLCGDYNGNGNDDWRFGTNICEKDDVVEGQLVNVIRCSNFNCQ